MEPITITLNGSEVSGHPGMTVLELATEVGIEIPTLCHDPHLSPLGACRVCLVEDETSGRLLASCVTPIVPGMVISTRSERVIENRRVVLDLILASHPDSCIVCDKGNRCRLKKIAADLGLGMSSLERIPSYSPLVDLNPFIRRDLSKCIRCGRCIRADQEIAVVGAIDFTDRGFEARPATLLDAPLERSECNFCGICVSVCPTGALSERTRVSTTTASHATRTVCTLCGTGCGILLEHRGNLVLGASPSGDKDSVNHISLCVKGHYGLDFVNAADRLATPLVRRNGELVPAAWDEALDLVAGRFCELKEAGRGLAALGASRCSNEENYLLQKLMRTALGSNNIDSGARLRVSALYTGIEQILGCGAMTHPMAHVRDASEILVVGADPLVASPILGQRIKQAVKFNGAHLTLVDPLPRGLSGFTGTWIRPAPGTYTVFLAGLLREILAIAGSSESLREHLPSEPAQRTIHAALEAWSPDRVEDLTGIPERLLRDTARRLASGRPLAVIPGAGVARDQGACLAGSILAVLLLLTGNLGRPGCGLFPIAGSLNDQGTLDMGALPDRLPGHQRVSDPEARLRFERAWGVAPPLEPGMDCISMIQAADRGELAGLYVVGENPARDCPDSVKTRRALSRLPFLVVQDLFLTETARLAHVVLPSTSFAEKDGTFTNLERRVLRVRRAIEPVGQSRPDWEILLELMGRLGGGAIPGSPAEVLREINDLVPLYRGITRARLDREKEGIFWPCFGEDDPGTPVLFAAGPPPLPEDFTMRAPDGIPAGSDPAYPLRLLATETLFHSADGVRTARSSLLVEAVRDGSVAMNPVDAGLLGLGDGDPVVVTSPAGSLQTRIVLSPEIPRGILTATSVASHAPSGLFSLAEHDSESRSPQMHRLAVRVEAANGVH